MWDKSHIMFDLAVLIRNIDRRLEQMGISAKQASLNAGLSDSYISQLKTGKSDNPRLDQLSKLGEALELTLPQMLDEAGLDPDRHAVFVAYDSDPVTRELLIRAAKGSQPAAPEPAPDATIPFPSPTRPRPLPPVGGSVAENSVEDCRRARVVNLDKRKIG